MLRSPRWKVLAMLAVVIAGAVFAVPWQNIVRDYAGLAPAVHRFIFNQNGTERFAKVTGDNVGQSLAIILDGQVISAARIMEPILAGSGQISGPFTIEDANNLAIVLRPGALPARLVYIDAAVKPTQEAQATRLDP
jgi:preprotein translocase subunit SecD